ncbi:hypothetical protein CALCODRAFT_482636 [Calocera cornea HHB12733]|uniref:RRM domain-containing protein n=1 Tax=Calocera cornea HHB12733 TaxID=1353952 RepID=A0A165GI60_9BASI|nr:hypothetical protein CALCODRAFT_482636 [Calocera cornea HHB12733]
MSATVMEEYTLFDLLQRAMIEALGERGHRLRMRTHVLVVTIQASPLEPKEVQDNGERILQIVSVHAKARTEFLPLLQMAFNMSDVQTRAKYPYPEGLLGVSAIMWETINDNSMPTMPMGIGFHKRLLSDEEMVPRIRTAATVCSLQPQQLPDKVWSRTMGVKTRLDHINSLIRSDSLRSKFITVAPKSKKTKMTLSDFLSDGTTGSWADEMDSLPTAPAPRMGDGGDRGRRDDFSRDFGARESRFPPRDELPLPTKPPFTAFLGNLAYDLTEADVEEFFAPHKLVSVKIIKERDDDRPKGFGYVEFEDLEGLKVGLERSGGSLNNRVVRVSVAEAQKGSFGSRGPMGEDDDKFDRAWRRDGPLPDLNDDRSSSRPPRTSRFSNDVPTNEAEDWRSTPRAAPPPLERGGPSRRGSGFSTPSEGGNEPSDWRSAPRAPRPSAPEGEGPRSRSFTPREPREYHAADTEETWAIGSKFKKSSPPPSESGLGPTRRGSRDNVPPREPREPAIDEEISDWRNAPRKGPLPTREGRFGDRKSPQSSTPPTPASRRKLELLPRGINSPSAPSSPLTSPPPSSAGLPHVKSNPFGDAKPIDVTAREKEIEEKIAVKEHEFKEEHDHKKHDHKHEPKEHGPAEQHEQHEKPVHSPAPAGPQPHQERPAHPSGAQDTWRRRGPPSERVTPSHSRQPSSGPGSSRGASRATTPPTHGTKNSPPPSEAPSPRAPANIRPTFSFAAAAASISIDEEGPEDQDKVNGVKEAIVDAVAAQQSGDANGATTDVDAVAGKIAGMATSDVAEDANGHTA